ncbi:MAG: 4-alpha-glucanotransferase [Melioribacteraceae bacterium]|nr:4-alpha-glucanotransferase [Melioribacteraceae bacterium]MCF8265150.1 4-alpha-glucanotransferase [Melioribacteraceae bacterium]
MRNNRSAGILLHPTSLPGEFGIGDLGQSAYDFVDFLVSARQSLWQVFPLGPTGYGDSPYQCFSAFAGNPLLISPNLLKDINLLSEDDLNKKPEFNPHHIDYGLVINYKNDLLKKSFENYKTKKDEALTAKLEKFISEQKDWLEDYSLFMACKEYHGGKLWTEWDEEIAFRRNNSIAEWRVKLEDAIAYQKFVQFLFFEQWLSVKSYANDKGIKIVGDLPIFIAYDSSDLWANRDLFNVDDKGKLITVAGVPPDYFSKTGQLWGNPLYKWEKMEQNNFEWWHKRFSQMYTLNDIVRIDHFRGFDAYYEIPGDAPTAQTGKWKKAPGEKLFESLKKNLGEVPIIAEDLGVITDSVEALRDKFGFPGMKILQFAFGAEGDKKFLPHNYIPNCVVYSGSHDNDTTKGFFDKAKTEDREIYEWAQKYLNYYGDDMCYAVIKLAYSSTADMVVIPMQDALNLGTEARMNFPGKLGGNWCWRFTWDQVYENLANDFKDMTIMYQRPPTEEIKNESID